MKKILMVLVFCLCAPFFVACETTDTEIANALEGNLTRLVYSVGYLDSISVDELNSLVNGGSSYFTNSSLYSGVSLASDGETPPDSLPETSLAGGLQTAASIDNLRNASFRTRLYNDGTTQAASTISTSNDGITSYNSGVVDISLLETSAADLNDILLEVSTKRGIIMLYCTDLRSGRASLSAEDKVALNEYIDIIKETTNYLNNNAGTLTGHYNNLVSVALDENSAEIVNARLIRANETLKTRYAKLDTCLDSLAAITNILTTKIGTTYIDLYNASLLSSGQGGSLAATENNNMDIINLDGLDSLSTLDEPIIETEENLDNNLEAENTLNTQNGCYNTNNSCYNSGAALYPNNNASINNNNISSNNSGVYNSTYQNNPPCCYFNNNGCDNSGACSKTNNTSTPTDNTIINYNYSGANSNSTNLSKSSPQTWAGSTNMVETNTPVVIPPTTTQTTLPQATTQTALPQTTNPTSPALINFNNGNFGAPPLSEEEIILNGGLVKNNVIINETENEKDEAAVSASVLAKNLKSEPLEKLSNTKDGSGAQQLNIVPPENKVEDNSNNGAQDITPLPSVPDLSEPEITESEKELTPDLIPFMGEGEREFLKPLGSPELGIISFAPITFEEDSPLMLLPRR